MAPDLRMNADQEIGFREINDNYTIATYWINPDDLTVRFRCENEDVGTVYVDGTWEWDEANQ